VNEAWFERRHEPDWNEFESLLAELDAGRGERAAQLPRRYRQLCQQLALARSRCLSAHLVDRLEQLALGGHRHLYAAPRLSPLALAEGVGRGFPRAVRAEWRLVVLCALLLLGPLAGLGAGIQRSPELVYSVIDREQVREYEAMYRPGSGRSGRPDSAAGDLLMFGFYVRNNVGIALSTFGSGVVFGLAPLILMLNGVAIGAVAGHLTHAGYGSSFWPFVIGHSAPELIAIVLAGAAGMRLGLALLAPGRLRRSEALRSAALGALPLVVGSAALLLVAAAIEAFWSGRSAVPAELRYAVGGVLWGALLAYLGLAGRSRAARAR
jgi:uncharacterized membrane protein SpoIIM required for sporulation